MPVCNTCKQDYPASSLGCPVCDSVALKSTGGSSAPLGVRAITKAPAVTLAAPENPAQRVLKNRYRLQEKLGEGGFAVTWKAIDQTTSRACVVKEVHLRRIEDQKSLELFEREAEVLKKLNHPRIPDFIDYFEEPSQGVVKFFLVQEFIDGKNLEQIVREGHRFTEAEAIELALKVAGILEYLHGFSPPFIHRDIKPSNIMLTPDGEAHLIDFGAVRDKMMQDRHTHGGGSTFVGTYGYIPQEQFGGRALPASDIFALGMTLLRVLSHKDPGDLIGSGMRVNVRDHVDVSAGFKRILEIMVEPAFQDRFQNVNALRLALKDPKGVLAPDELSPHRPVRKRAYGAIVPLTIYTLMCGLITYLGSFMYHAIFYENAGTTGMSLPVAVMVPPAAIASVIIRSLRAEARWLSRKHHLFRILFGGVSTQTGLWVASSAVYLVLSDPTQFVSTILAFPIALVAGYLGVLLMWEGLVLLFRPQLPVPQEPPHE